MRDDNRTLLVILGVLVAALLIGPLLMGGMMGTGFAGPGMMGWGYVGGAPGTTSGWVWGLGMALGGLLMLAFWGALIVGVVLLVRSVTRRGGSTAEDPLIILRRRYAAGEIDQPTFERMRAELGETHQSATPNERTEARR